MQYKFRNVHGVDRDEKTCDVEHHKVEEPQEACERL